jgi:FtsH-binding integral membrane protein
MGNATFFAGTTVFDVMPLIHWLHDAMPSFVPGWIKWGLIVLLGASTAFLFIQLGKKYQQWRDD